ncbi:MAG: decarboxylating NADP(+)-dependent phosphogluconate dehydrogenase [Deltaproteobacteria bacterium]|nr:decarboxylating NADP(+)-dependent phosphogluconate dehydrogenase [Deltaproteobacteria bacterium]
MEKQADIGLIGLAVMGENLVLNMEQKGLVVAVYNRTVSRVDDLIRGRGQGKNIIGTSSLEELVNVLPRPRKIIMMVRAGEPVDRLIQQLAPLLEAGDVLIDGGNSHFEDTDRRTQEVEGRGLLYVGTGISGGEEGALKGPAIMPGGSSAAWELIKPVFEAIAARADDGRPCCRWIGPGGAGHFVKMVHNGIEYGDMQLICESYHLLREALCLKNQEIGEIFYRWNQGDLKSYLIEITARIVSYQDGEGHSVLESILDTAGQKGTGQWTVNAALDLGVPLTLIGEAVFSRYLSAMKEERVRASAVLSGPEAGFQGDQGVFVDDLERALYVSKIVCYAQGFALLKAASETFGWGLNYGDMALIWRNGCIIRSVFLHKIADAFHRNPDLSLLLLDPFFQEKMNADQAGWRRVVSTAIRLGIPVPALAGALNAYDGLRSAWLPANLLQAQRDYFGAHRYERIDRPRGEFFHTNWTGEGGDTTSSSYGR